MTSNCNFLWLEHRRQKFIHGFIQHQSLKCSEKKTRILRTSFNKTVSGLFRETRGDQLQKAGGSTKRLSFQKSSGNTEGSFVWLWTPKRVSPLIWWFMSQATHLRPRPFYKTHRKNSVSLHFPGPQQQVSIYHFYHGRMVFLPLTNPDFSLWFVFFNSGPQVFLHIHFHQWLLYTHAHT